MSDSVALPLAFPGDKPHALDFLECVWENRDYFPLVGDDGYDEPMSLLAAMEFHGQYFGFSKQGQLSKEEGRLEGFRIDPAY
ncbi:MAG: hypothetical protein KAR65_06210 [Anaerolineales bacterium]|nr:hypothetical protein [Anaerolineales bacterium]